MLKRSLQKRCAPSAKLVRRADLAGGGHTLASMVKGIAMRRTRRKKAAHPLCPSKAERLEAGALLREKRAELLEQGREVPQALKGVRQRRAEKTLRRLEDKEPAGIPALRKLHHDVPEVRQLRVQNDFCTDLNGGRSFLHPAARRRWWEILKAAPQGLLRYHLREVVPMLEDRMKETKFHEFYQSSDIEILKRKGLVFEGRDGEPLKLTKEELRLVRQADMYKKIDPRAKARVRAMVQRRVELRSKKLPQSPTYRPLVYSEGDALAYVGYRTYPMYAVMLRVYGEILKKAPQFAPRHMLDFGAGHGVSIFSAVEVWKGVASTLPPNSSEHDQMWHVRYLKKERTFQHPRLQHSVVREELSVAITGEVTALEKKATEVRKKVELGLLPSGTEVEVEDAAEASKALLSDEVWDAAEGWRTAGEAEGGQSADTGLDEDFLGEGMYAASKHDPAAQKPFEETDYFLEKDHEAYPKPPEAAALEARGLRVDKYIDWFNTRSKWADAYYKHVEKQKMERDPGYRSHASAQHLKAAERAYQPDETLESSKLHESEPETAVVYGNWKKREAEILGRVTAVEPSKAMTSYGIDFLVDAAPHVHWKKFLTEAPAGQSPDSSDLVVAAYTLSELTQERLRSDSIRALWEACTGVLVIVEAGTPAGFKLVMDARTTILSEYDGVGPWESQPSVLAPCPHNNVRCPLMHSLFGHNHKNMRTCYSTAQYSQSSVESWVTGERLHGEHASEQYSYCIIARNDVIPSKAIAARSVPKYTPTVVTENPEKMADDPRIQSLLERGKKSGLYNRIALTAEDVQYPRYVPLPFPDTEANQNPFTGRWKMYSKMCQTSDLVALYKEKEEYLKEFRSRQWLYNRVVRSPMASPLGGHYTLDVCTPHATLERVSVLVSRKAPLRSHELVQAAEAGALFPNFAGLRREEFIQGDNPNTFVPRVKYLSPLEDGRLRKQGERGAQREQDEADAETHPEEVAQRKTVEEHLRSVGAKDAEATAASVEEAREHEHVFRDFINGPREQ